MGIFISANMLQDNNVWEAVSSQQFYNNVLLKSEDAEFKATNDIRSLFHSIGFPLKTVEVIEGKELLKLSQNLMNSDDYLDYVNESTYYGLVQFVSLCWIKQFAIVIY